MEFYALTQTQLGMYLDWNADRESTQYNIAVDNVLPAGTIDVQRLAAAVEKVFATYPVYRLRFTERDGEVMQFIDDSLKLKVETITTKEADFAKHRAEFVKPFDPFTGPMLRAKIVTTEKELHLLTDAFHLVSDGTEQRNFFEAVSAAYEGRPFPVEQMSFVDYATLEPTLFENEEYAAAKAVHVQRFAGKSMTVPSVGTRSDAAAAGHVRMYATVPRAGVEAFCRAHEIHPNLFFMGAFARTLALYASTKEAVFFTVNHGRRDPRIKETFGAFVKSVPVLAELRGDLNLSAWLNSLKLHKAGVYPFTHFCRDLGIAPGFGYVFQDGTVNDRLRIGDLPSSSCMYSDGGVGKMPIMQVHNGDADNYRFWMSQVDGEYSNEWLQGFLDRMTEVVRQFLAHPDALLKDIPTVSEKETVELLALGKGEDLEYDHDDTVAAAFSRHAQEDPHRIAFVDCETKLTYGEAFAQASALASQLCEAGVTPGSFVGVMLPRRVSFSVSTLAIQLCGAGYVPLDAEYPDDRLAYMLEDSCAPVLATTHELYDSKKIPFVGKVIFWEEEKDGNTTIPHSSLLTSHYARPEGPAYMIYTSGSTGKPKGVQISNRALMAFCAAMKYYYGLNPETRIAIASSFSFDASVMDLFPIVFAGGTLHIISEEMRKDLAAYRDYIAKERIDGCTLSTHFGLALLNAYPDVTLKFMCLGGEKLVPYPPTKVKVYNGYGPTEFTVESSVQLVDQSATGDIPIGRPVPNSLDILVDQFGQLVPRGMQGELCLAGAQIAEGYWHLPEKTSKVFAALPENLLSYACCPGCGGGKTTSVLQQVYHTGDYATWNEDGLLMYKGRIDKQVKLRGFRIEMGEIEHAASSFPGVAAAVAEVREISGVEHLVLYYEAGNNRIIESSNNRIDVDALKKFLGERLAAFMVPDYFVELAELPMTPGGKIDRKALPLPALSDDPVVEPANEIEAKILAELRAVLHTEAIGVEHDFNRIGLTSLGAMALVAKLKKAHGLAVSLSKLAKAGTVRSLANMLAGTSQASENSKVEAKPATNSRRPRRATYPMTESQRGVYSDWLRNPQGTAYNMPFVLRFKNADAKQVADAVTFAIDAHPAFKTRFIEKDGEIVQQRRDDAKIEIAIEKLDAEPPQEYFAAFIKPFATAGEDLVRIRIVEYPAGVAMFFDAHHTVCDGVSTGAFLNDILNAIAGKPLVGEAASAFDAALDERDYFESELKDEDETWFAKYLDGCESTALELGVAPADIPAGTAGAAKMRISAAEINRRANELGVSASDFFLGALMELLRRIGRSDDVQITFVSAGRGDPDLSTTVGMFVKTLPVRNVKDEATFSGMVKKLKDQVLEIRDRDRVSYARLAQANGLSPEIIFAYEGGLFDLPEGMALEAFPERTAKFPLSVTVTPGKDDFEIGFEYDASRFAAETMQKFLAMYANLVEVATAIDDLKSIPLVDDAEATELWKLAYGGDIEYDETKTFVNLFNSVVRTRSFATAVVDAKSSLTYGELDEQSSAIAQALIERGVKPGEFVAIKMGRVKEFVVAAIGIMKAGAAYVPIDPAYPQDRIDYMVSDSQAKVIVDEAFVSSLIPHPSSLHSHPSSLIPHPSSPAYMIYTSGSTGKPKGVVLPHRALRHMLAWMVRDSEITYESKVLEHASFSFDASVISMFPVLSAGGELHILAEELRKDVPGMREYILKNGITSAIMSTQIGMALLDAYPDLPLHDVMFGGEKLMPIAKTDVKIFNGYGPTEFAVSSSYEIVDQSKPGDIPIGRAVAGTWSIIVDRYGHLLPRGFAGELALVGPQIADGYWHQPEKTEKAFVKLPSNLLSYACCSAAGGKTASVLQQAYRTGDLARYNADDKLDYLGRLDFQVKLRGFRIEIGEIEHVAKSFPGIGAVAAEVRDVGGAKHLVLYYEAGNNRIIESSNNRIDVDGLKKFLGERLTEYMVPDYFVEVEKMPITPNGKIDRRKLKSPSAADSPREYVEPANDTERAIAKCYGEILKLDKFGATDDFFALGGTSIVAIKAVVALQKAGLDVQYADVFKHKTPRALAAFLTGTSVDASATCHLPPVTSVFGDYDYAAIDKLLSSTRTELFDGFRVHSLGDVLLTGATGYLGIHVLKYLLEKTSSSVTVLLRQKGKAGPERRLNAQYVYYFGERIPQNYCDRISYVAGDITDANLAEKLADVDISTVINCAALVKHFIADDALDRVNVQGVENLLAWCSANHARFIQTSTYSIGGTVGIADPARLDERHLYVGQSSDNDYIRTKFLAERAVLAAIAAGKVKGKVMRLGNLMGRESDGEFQMNVGANAFINSLKSYKAIGAFPLEELAAPLEMSPIDRVAEAICLLSTTPDDMVVFHPYNAYALDMGAVLGALCRRGYTVDFTSRGDFAAHVEAVRNDPRKADELQGILHYAQRHLGEIKPTPVANAWTTTVLYRLGFRWKPADDNYLANFFNMLTGIGVFE